MKTFSDRIGELAEKFNANTKTLYVLVGIPGSGKSTWAKRKIKEDDNTIVVEADSIREELFGDPAKQYDDEFIQDELHMDPYKMDERAKMAACNKYVYGLVDKRTEEGLESGRSVIYDGTNLKLDLRRKTIDKFRGLYDRVVAVFIKASENLELCQRRNSERTRKVPKEVIEGMYKRMVKPSTSEGFDEVIEV